MKIRHSHPGSRAAIAGALLALAGCGGSDSSDPGTTTPLATTTNVTTKVIDGVLRNALVCMDKNRNGKCDLPADEVQDRTDTNGNVTLPVPNADVGKYPIIAMADSQTVDAEHGAVTKPFTLSTPLDQTAVISPLTTLVQSTIAGTGVTTSEAATAVQATTGITASLFADYTNAPAPQDGSINPATVARLVVLTTQQQAAAIPSTVVGTSAIDGTAITQAQLDTAIQKKLLELLPDLVAALSDPAVTAATTPAAREAALLAAATTVVTNSGLTPASVPTVVAINTQTSTPTTAAAPTPAAGFQLQILNFTNATNYFFRTFGASLAQATPDAANTTRFVERRTRANNGNVARWSFGGDPQRNSDLHWSGSAWIGCPINFENVSSVRDALGNSTYNYCDGYDTGKTNRATFDIAGKSMADVYAQVRAAGFTNLTIATPTLLGSATFPTGAALFYQASTPLTNAIAYYPAGANSPAGTSNVVSQYTPAISAGGTASAQPAGTGCNSAESNTNGTSSITLEAMIAAKTGKPCVYGPGSFVYSGVTYSSALNEWWTPSTLSIGTVGSAPVNSGTAPGYFTTNTLVRLAFTGTGTDPVTYYACRQRFIDGSTRNCTAIGTGSYAIATLGDARVLTLTGVPAQAAPLTYNRVFVERGGLIYFGYQSKPAVSNTARLNTAAANALLGQLGLTADDPSVPMALTAGSYQGTWDVRDTLIPFGPSEGDIVFINGNGTTSCRDSTGRNYSCTINITDPATGAFTFLDFDTSASGNFNFLAGTTSGSWAGLFSPFESGTFIGGRR